MKAREQEKENTIDLSPILLNGELDESIIVDEDPPIAKPPFVPKRLAFVAEGNSKVGFNNCIECGDRLSKIDWAIRSAKYAEEVFRSRFKTLSRFVKWLYLRLKKCRSAWVTEKFKAKKNEPTEYIVFILPNSEGSH